MRAQEAAIRGFTNRVDLLEEEDANKEKRLATQKESYAKVRAQLASAQSAADDRAARDRLLRTSSCSTCYAVYDSATVVAWLTGAPMPLAVAFLGPKGLLELQLVLHPRTSTGSRPLACILWRTSWGSYRERNQKSATATRRVHVLRVA